MIEDNFLPRRIARKIEFPTREKWRERERKKESVCVEEFEGRRERDVRGWLGSCIVLYLLKTVVLSAGGEKNRRPGGKGL